MVLALGILMGLYILREVLIKKDLLSPPVFWCGVWMISSIFVAVDPYNIRLSIGKATIIIWIGVIAFLVGDSVALHFRIKTLNKRIIRWELNDFSPITCYVYLGIAFVFSITMLVTTVSILRKGVPYAYVRDVIFGYDESINITFFSSSFISTFYSWIVSPCITVLLLILLTNLITKQLPKWFNVVALIDLIIFCVANAGRSIIYHSIVLTCFVYFYYGIKMKKKLRKRIIIGFIVLLILFVIMTFYRTKDASKVSPLYSYFSIDYPLLSYWSDYIDQSGNRYYGNGFFRGILEGVNFILGKIGLATPLYWEMQEVFARIQNKWIMVFDNNWYNAYVTCFFYFYMDFGFVGVAFGSAIFGFISREVYKHARKERSLLSVLLYMLVIQYIVDSMIRWQFGMLSGLIPIIFIFFSVKRLKRADLRSE